MNDEFESEASFSCPYCGTEGFLMVDASAGKHQQFTTDCETCCRPILITIDAEEDGDISIHAARE